MTVFEVVFAVAFAVYVAYNEYRRWETELRLIDAFQGVSDDVIEVAFFGNELADDLSALEDIVELQSRPPQKPYAGPVTEFDWADINKMPVEFFPTPDHATMVKLLGFDPNTDSTNDPDAKNGGK